MGKIIWRQFRSLSLQLYRHIKSSAALQFFKKFDPHQYYETKERPAVCC